MSANLPTGTVTFLFTDVENSTKLWEQYPGGMKAALARHDQIVRQAIEKHGGTIIKTTGDGFHAAFQTGLNGVAAAADAQEGLSAESWDEIQPNQIRVRMGLHTGEAEERAGDYYGPSLNRAARLMSVGHGGQILLSVTTADLVRDHLQADTSLRDLGEHRLKDLVRSEHIFQLNQLGLPADFPALKSIDTYPNNIPVQLTTFIGREHEMGEARKLLSSGRLLTLIGPGGTGKTRLSLQLAADVLPSFADGVWVAELAPLTDPALIIQTVASVFGLREQLGMPLTGLVIDYLRAKELLLVLDNCEHLIDACAQWTDQLLHACLNVKILASSREALGISGEAVYRVPSLSLPAGSEVTRDMLIQSESVQLFVERAIAANPKFVLTDQNTMAVAQICRRLDGIPLALELAAARLTIFSAEQIASHLDDRFRLLTGGSRTALPRQQTLRALIDWSYELLTENERTLLRRFSVFYGWTFEAAEAVCSELDVLNLLTQLVNKSLIAVEGESGESRYRLLETVRQYARDKLLEMHESELARIAHFNYYAELVITAEKHLRSSEALLWVARLELEYDNIRAALQWGAENNLEPMLRMIPSLEYFWNRRGYEEEARHLIIEALERANKLPLVEDNANRQRQSVLGAAWETLGMLAYNQGDNERGEKASRQAAALARQSGDNSLLALALGYQAFGIMFLGKTEGIDQLLNEGLEAARTSGNKLAMGIILSTYGQYIEVTAGDVETARRYSQEAEESLREYGDLWSMTMKMLSGGIVAKLQGDYLRARRQFSACAPVFRDLGDLHRVNMVKSEIAHLDRYDGLYDQAESVYRETIREWQRLGHRAAIAHQLECFATLAKLREEGARAATLFGAAEALREKIMIPMTEQERVEYAREVGGLKAGMDEKVFSVKWAQGRAMSMEEAIAFAIETAP